MAKLTEEEIEILKMTKSQKALKYFRDKINIGKIENADAILDYTGPCKETMKLYLKITQNKIEKASFQYKGCSSLACCGSALTELIEGKTIQEAKRITEKEVLEHLKSSPIKDFDCPLLAVKTLEKVIGKYEKRKR